MFTSFVLHREPLHAAVKYGTRYGKFNAVSNKKANTVRLTGAKAQTVKDMGFSFWEKNKYSIISDIAVATLAVIVSLGLGFAHASLPICLITVGSLLATATAIDLVGFRVNSHQLANRIKTRLATADRRTLREINGRL